MRIPRIGPCRECDSPIQAQGLCSKHYKRAQTGRRGPCSVDECSTPAAALGLCGRHYKNKRLANAGECSTGCGRPVVILAGRLCTMHYKRVQEARLPLCTEPRCERRSKARGLCGIHLPRRLRGLLPPERAAYYATTTGCDVCRSPLALEDSYLDHDHDHCAQGCTTCIRGLVCAACNTLEGNLRSGLRRGVITSMPTGRLATYLLNPPLQEWLRGRDEAAPLEHAA
jgi:hypothetical protein